MTIDLSAVPTLTDSLGLYDIPLNVDTFPYAQLQAQGRYPDRSTPNTLPEFLSTLNATDRNFNPDMPSTDGNRNLNVNIAAGGGGGGGGGTITPVKYVNSFAVQDLDIGGDLGSDTQHFIFDATALTAWFGIWFAIDVKMTSLTAEPPSFRLDFSGGSGPAIYWPVAILYPTLPPVVNGWGRGQVYVPLNPPADPVAMGLNQSDLHARVWGGGLYGGTAEIVILGQSA